MIQRCTNPNNEAYDNYGGRGIRVCTRWLKFENFLADMGEPPDDKELDRKDNDGDYRKSNCRWVTRRKQQNNKRTNVVIEHKGKARTIAEWARKLEVPADLLYSRYRCGKNLFKGIDNAAK